jgi:hypothetical protein
LLNHAHGILGRKTALILSCSHLVELVVVARSTECLTTCSTRGSILTLYFL